MTILEIGVLIFLLWNSIYDIRKKEIVPMSVYFFLILRIVAFVSQILKMENGILTEVTPLILGVVPGIAILVLGCISKGAIGKGDGVVLMVVGLYIGMVSVVEVFLWGLLLASIWGVLFLGLKRYRWKSRIPFVPFLLAGYGLCLVI